VLLTNDEKPRDTQTHRNELIRIGNWAICSYPPMGLAYITHYCGFEADQPYLVAFKYNCAHCQKSVPDEVQALYRLMEDGYGFIEEQ